MVSVIKPAALLLMSEHCFEEYMFNGNIFDVACFKQSLSKSLGLGIILGSVFVKLPQILKLMKNQSAKGLSIYSVLLDLTAISVTMSYNFVNGFPISSYGESLCLAIQTAIIAALVLNYSSSQLKAIIFSVVYTVIVAALMGGAVPISVLWTLQGFTIPILISGRSIQVYENYKNGSTGQLSAATIFSLAAGSTARIFTTMQETGDKIMIITFIVASIANYVLSFQMYYYWNVGKKPAQTKSKKKQTKKDN